MLPSRMFRQEFALRGLARELSRAVEDSGTLTSVLFAVEYLRGLHLRRPRCPPTAAYLPFCFFNILSPLLDVLFGFIGFKVPSFPPEEQLTDAPAGKRLEERVRTYRVAGCVTVRWRRHVPG